MRVAYVATFPLHCFNYFCTLTEASQYTWLAHFGLLTYTCYVYALSVALFIVDEKQTCRRCGITPFQKVRLIDAYVLNRHVHGECFRSFVYCIDFLTSLFHGETSLHSSALICLSVSNKKKCKSKSKIENLRKELTLTDQVIYCL